MKSAQENLATNLQTRLQKLGWTNAFLAQKIGTSASNVTLWLSCKTFPRAKQLDQIAEVIGIEVYELFLPDGTKERGEKIKPGEIISEMCRALGYEAPRRLKKLGKSSS